MKYLHKFFSLSRGKQIALVVCFVHVCAILGLLIHHVASTRFRPARPIVVRTLAMAPPVEVRSVEAPPKATPPQPVAKKSPSPPAAKTKPSAPIKGVQAVSSKPAKKEAPLLQAIAQNLETLTKETVQPRSQLSIPSRLGAKTEIVSPKAGEDPTYGEYVVAFLQNALDLPEYGEVKAKIEIDRYGQLVNCQILETKSRKNADFLKNRLPELTFPCLNSSSHTFTITFRNVENY